MIMDCHAPILHLIATGFFGGPEKQILSHVRALRAAGIDGRIGSFEENGRPELLKLAEDAGIPTLFVPSGNPMVQYLALADTLGNEGIQALCTHGFKANVLGYFASRRACIPHLAFVRGWTAETPKVRLYEMLDRWVLRRTQHVACVSRPQAEYLLPRRRNLPAPWLVPNAVLAPPHATFTNDEDQDVQALNLPENTFIFGAIGRLSQEKGHADLVDALAILLRNEQEIFFHLVVLGEGRERAALETHAQALRVQDRIHFVGFRRNVLVWLKHMDCLVQPSHTEGTPNSVLEAMFAGTPVIATAVGGVPDLIEDNRSGLLVPSHAPQALAQAMLRLAQSATLREQLIQSAYQRAQEFSPEAQLERFLAVYQTVFQLQSHGTEVPV